MRQRSRLIRVRTKKNKPVKAEVAVDGFKLSNAVIWRKNNVYVSDTFLDLPDDPGWSAWTTDPDFGYEIASSIPGFDDEELLQPKKLYERQGRMDEYNSMVQKLKTERIEYLESWSGLDSDLIDSMR